MKLTYDPARNIAYLRLHEKKGPVDTIRVSDELNVDMAPDGTVYGIELLNANEQLQTEADGSLVMINKPAAKRKERLLAVHEEAAEYKTAKRKTSQRKK
ncbi:MAG: DUF2283 domain-containing protein [Kiritimatiellales bacterium]